MKWIGALWTWLRRFFPGRQSKPYSSIVVEDVLPGRLDRRALYIVADGGFAEQAAMICPCGCSEILHMNLLPDERPCWQVLRHANGTASLHPSVWRQVGCRSHFWFREGRVVWCPDL